MVNIHVLGKTCSVCGVTHEIEVRAEDFRRWKRTDNIQDVFPYLSADDRELLISGICGSCFDDMFGEEE